MLWIPNTSIDQAEVTFHKTSRIYVVALLRRHRHPAIQLIPATTSLYRMQSTRIATNRNYDLYSERLISYVEYPVRSTTEATSLLKGARARARASRTHKKVCDYYRRARKEKRIRSRDRMARSRRTGNYRFVLCCLVARIFNYCWAEKHYARPLSRFLSGGESPLSVYAFGLAFWHAFFENRCTRKPNKSK